MCGLQALQRLPYCCAPLEVFTVRSFFGSGIDPQAAAARQRQAVMALQVNCKVLTLQQTCNEKSILS